MSLLFESFCITVLDWRGMLHAAADLYQIGNKHACICSSMRHVDSASTTSKAARRTRTFLCSSRLNAAQRGGLERGSILGYLKPASRFRK